MKDQNFFEEDWDHAIILDAARYDVFKEVYDDYFDGELEKRRSPASATPEWTHKKFEGRHRINWYSTNPFINGTGKPLNAVGAVEYETVPSKHIANIIDLWDEAWDEELGAVRPEDVNREFLQRKDELADRRNVIHYMQPHVPFIGHGKGRINKHLQQSFSQVKDNELSSGFADGIMDRMPDFLDKIEDTEVAMKLGLYSSLDAASLWEVFRGDSREVLMKYHEENLRNVMEHAAELVDELDGKVVVTSDHGDAFGEEGVWGHHVETHVPPLVEVPWLEIDS